MAFGKQCELLCLLLCILSFKYYSKRTRAVLKIREYLTRIFHSFSWGIFSLSHMTRLDQSRREKYLMDYKREYPFPGENFKTSASLARVGKINHPQTTLYSNMFCLKAKKARLKYERLCNNNKINCIVKKTIQLNVLNIYSKCIKIRLIICA